MGSFFNNSFVFDLFCEKKQKQCDLPVPQLETTGVLNAAEVLMQSIDILASKLKDIRRAIKAEAQGTDGVPMQMDEGLQGGYDDGY